MILLMAGGFGSLLGCREQSRASVDVPVLMYHTVEANPPPNHRLRVPSDVFERQIAALRAEGYTSVWPSDVVQYFEKGTPLPPKPIIITFDDGTRDLLTVAQPILERYGFRGVGFLITGVMADSMRGTNSLNWRKLTWEDVRVMNARGTIRFGGHTRTHSHLIRVKAKDADEEIRGCFRDLQARGIAEPEGFSYPFGEYRQATVESVRKAGFRIAFSTKNGVARLDTAGDLLTVGRIGVVGGKRDARITLVDNQGASGTVVRVFFDAEMSHRLQPRFVWNGIQPHEGWMPVVSVQKGPLEWRLSPETHVQGKQGVALELWGPDRVIHYGRFPVESDVEPDVHSTQ